MAYELPQTNLDSALEKHPDADKGSIEELLADLNSVPEVLADDEPGRVRRSSRSA